MKKLGFGCMRLPLTAPDDLSALDFEQINNMADLMLENGFTYFDTAYPYHNGASETGVKKFLTDRRKREDFKLATKMPLWYIKSADDFEKFFTEQLCKCGVKFFDYYLMHNINASTYKTAKKYGGFGYLKNLKKDGRAKNIGFSFHDGPELLDEVLTANPGLDFVQLQINYIDWENPVIQSRRCYEVARRHNVPIIVMEPVKGGSLVNIPPAAAQILKNCRPDMSIASWALRYAASLDGVFMVLSGMSNLSQVQDNVSFMKDFEPLSEKEKSALEKVVGIMQNSSAVQCTDCKYCVAGCPKNIPIPDYFSLYNNAVSADRVAILGLYYTNLAKEKGKAGDCIACGKCERACPQHIEIIKHLKKVSKMFDSAYSAPPKPLRAVPADLLAKKQKGAKHD